MLYYYDKDNWGREVCARFEDKKEFEKWCSENVPESNEFTIVQYVNPGDDIRELCNGDDSPDTDELVATVADADERGMKRPYIVICWGSCDYEAFRSKSDVNWETVYFEWSDWEHFQIQPTYYEAGEITPEQAEKEHMYLLAEYIREDLGLNNEEDYDDDNE